MSRPCHNRHDGREVIVVQICLHNKLRARHRVTNRSMSYSTYSKVRKETNKPCDCCRQHKRSCHFFVSVSFYNSVTHSLSRRAVICPFYKITLIVRLVFLGPLCEGGGCGAEPLEVQQFIEIHEGRAC